MRFRWTNDLVMVVYGSTGSQRISNITETAFPPVDVMVTDGCVHISADLPGVDKDDVCIYIQYDKLVIEGNKQAKYPQKADRRFLRVERLYKPFRRTIKIHTPVNPDTITSEMSDGVLHIKWKIA